MNKYLFIGLDYQHHETRQIDSIINIYKLTEYIVKKYGTVIDPDNIITDSKDKSKTTRQGILMRLYKLGLETWHSDIANVFIYYAGDSIDLLEYINGSNVRQGIVPSDYGSIISKEELAEILHQYNPRTRIIFIADCCFIEQNILGLKYTLDIKNDAYNILDNCFNIPSRRILTLSYCIDKPSHRSDDNQFNVLNYNQKINSYADYIAKLDDRTESIFELLQDITEIFKRKNINMRPVLSASYLPDNNEKILSVFQIPAKRIEVSSFEEYKKRSYTHSSHSIYAPATTSYACYC